MLKVTAVIINIKHKIGIFLDVNHYPAKNYHCDTKSQYFMMWFLCRDAMRPKVEWNPSMKTTA